ncbi:MAG: polysaccharide deacetylase [Pseudomonadota bacterium]
MLRNPIPWPNGARCAVAFTFDMDGESLIHVSYPDTADAKVASTSDLRYGPEVGVPRILDIYKKFGLRQTFFIPGWCIENYPATIEAILADGHEIGHHGWLHGKPNLMSDNEEADDIARGVEAIVKATGSKPRGFRAPSYAMSRRTLGFLQDHGMVYDASLMGDDIPYVVENERGSLVELPSHWPLDDWTQYVTFPDFGVRQPIKAPSEAYKVHVEEFDAAWEHGAFWCAVWHPFVSGRLARAMAIEQLIEHMLEKGDVWFARMDEIADYVSGLIAAGTWTPRRHALPFWPDVPIPAVAPRRA